MSGILLGIVVLGVTWLNAYWLTTDARIDRDYERRRADLLAEQNELLLAYCHRYGLEPFGPEDRA